MITRGDVMRALDAGSERGRDRARCRHDATLSSPILTRLLHDASAKMLRNNIGRLPVVDRKDPSTSGWLSGQARDHGGASCGVWTKSTCGARLDWGSLAGSALRSPNVSIYNRASVSFNLLPR